MRNCFLIPVQGGRNFLFGLEGEKMWLLFSLGGVGQNFFLSQLPKNIALPVAKWSALDRMRHHNQHYIRSEKTLTKPMHSLKNEGFRCLHRSNFQAWTWSHNRKKKPLPLLVWKFGLARTKKINGQAHPDIKEQLGSYKNTFSCLRLDSTIGRLFFTGFIVF